MAADAPPRIDLTAVGPVSLGSAIWRRDGRVHVTLIVKASFGFVPDGAMTVGQPDEIVRAEVHHLKNPARSVRFTSDLAPYLARADVTLVGHAVAPRGQPATAGAVRLALFRDRALLDKTIQVRGDAGPAGPLPFDRIPLVYERAFGGIGRDENPFGTGAGPSETPPNLVDPRDPERPACFAPLSRAWPARRRAIDPAVRSALEKPIAEIPGDFDWAYFQSAPPDQQIGYLAGDEWVVLEGVHPTSPRVQSRLPGARAAARVFGLGDAAAGQPLVLVADTLRIDADELCCSVVWRGSFPVPSEAALAAVRVMGGVDLPGQPLVWPPLRPVARSEAFASTMRLPDGFGDALPAGARVAPRPAAGRPAGKDEAPPSEVLEDVTDLVSTFETGDAPEAPGEHRFARTAEIPPEAGAPAPTLPFGPGKASVLPPPTERFSSQPPVPPSDDDHPLMGTLALEDPQQAGGAPSLPFAGRRPRGHRLPEFDQGWPEVPAPGAPMSPVVAATPPFAPIAKRPAPQGAMRIVAPSPLVAAVEPWRANPARDCLTVIAKATCDLVPGLPAVLRAEAEPISGDVHAGDDPRKSLVRASDRALFKVRADVTLTGHAWAKDGGTTAATAMFRFGDPGGPGGGFTREIAVFGDRRWEKGIAGLRPSAPRSFQRMPLGYEHAFGGPAFEANPIGAGHPGKMRRGDQRTPLPHLEDPGALLRTPNQTRPPACFAPVPLAWKARAAEPRAGRTPWPLFPEDFDWTRFQVAPPAQQLPFLRGDEPFAIHGMHRVHAELEGSLPGVAVRCFAREASGRFAEIEMLLDTAAFDVDTLALTLVWRGARPVPDEAAPGIEAIYLMTEPLAGTPITLAAARARFERA
jgi:hypothetical protein